MQHQCDPGDIILLLVDNSPCDSNWVLHKEVEKLLTTCLCPPNCVARTLKSLHVHSHFCSLAQCIVSFLAYSHSPIVSSPVCFTVRWLSVYLTWRYYPDEFLWCRPCRDILILVPWCWPLCLMCLGVFATDTLVWRGLARLLVIFISCVGHVSLWPSSRQLCCGIRITNFFVLTRERNYKLYIVF